METPFYAYVYDLYIYIYIIMDLYGIHMFIYLYLHVHIYIHSDTCVCVCAFFYICMVYMYSIQWICHQDALCGRVCKVTMETKAIAAPPDLELIGCATGQVQPRGRPVVVNV